MSREIKTKPLTHFSPMFHFYNPLPPKARQKTFSGGIDMEHWAKMD